MRKTFKSKFECELEIDVYEDADLSIGLSSEEGVRRARYHFDPAKGPAIALAVLEASGVKARNHDGVTIGTPEDLAQIVMNLKNYIDQESYARALAAKEAADREAQDKRRNELAIEFGCSNLGYKDTFESTQRAIDRVIELENKAKS